MTPNPPNTHLPPPLCPHCGDPLPANAPDGLLHLCPRCLLATGTATLTAEGESRAFTPPTPEELQRYFPQLEVLGFLGRGGMGAVYKARQRELDRIVAVKILPPGIAGERAGDDHAFAERFTREARALAKLNHPHIVTLYDFGQVDGLFYFFMEYVDGVNLRQLLNGRRITPEEALAIVPQICDALQYAHDRGIVHRDIKPENLLLNRDGQVKIADFGVARIVSGEASETTGDAPHSGMTEAGRVVGTPSYMAPEQLNRPQEADHRADIYSLGVVFYQMLTGELPKHNLALPSKRVKIDVRLDEIVLRALEHDPEQRYQQASLFKTQVETLAQSSQPTPRPTPPMEPASVWRRFWAFVIDACLVQIAVFPLLLLLAFFFPKSVVLEVPFGLFTQEKVIKSAEHRDADVPIRIRKLEVTPLGLHSYIYTEITPLDKPNAKPERTLIDPFWAVRATPTGTINLWALFLYWVLLECSPLQASLGKRYLGICVGNAAGNRLGFWQSLWRNSAKAISLGIAGLGFLLAFFTPRKRALHDFLSRSALTARVLPAPASSRGLIGRGAMALALAVGLPLVFSGYANWSFTRLSERHVEEMSAPLQHRRHLLDATSEAIIPTLLATLEKEGDAAAVEKLLAVKWDQQRLFAPGDKLAMSEREFIRLPYRERNGLHEQLLDALKQLRKLTQATVTAGQQAMASHDWERAERCFNALSALGRSIDRGDYAIILHSMGQNIEQVGARRLAEVEAALSDVKNVTFGREKEATLAVLATAPKEAPSRFQFRSGKAWSVAELEKHADWEKAFDVIAQIGENPPIRGLVGYNMVALPVADSAWSEMKPEVIYHSFSSTRPGNPVVIHEPSTRSSPTIYLFKTRDDARGLLKITDVDEKQGTVRFLYKLVELEPPPPGGNAAMAESITSSDAVFSKKVNRPRLELRGEAPQDATDGESVPFAKEGQEPLRLEKTAALTEGDVFSAEVQDDQEGRRLNIKFTDEGSAKFSNLTARLHGKRIAIIFDGKILLAPVVQATISGGNFSIIGDFTKKELLEIRDAISSH